MVKVTVMEPHCQLMMLIEAAETPVEVTTADLNIVGEKVPQSCVEIIVSAAEVTQMQNIKIKASYAN